MSRVAKFNVVFDCNVLLQAAAREKSVAADCFRLAESGVVKLYVSQEVLDELEEVLTRPEIQARFGALTDETVGAFLQRLRGNAQFMRQVSRQFTYSRDVDDEPYINLAVAVGADYIVSRDKDLLALMYGYTNECKEFRQRFRPLKVIEPLDLLRLIKSTEV